MSEWDRHSRQSIYFGPYPLSSSFLSYHNCILCAIFPSYHISYLLSLTSWLFILLVQAATRTETNDLKELLDVSREYITAVRVKAAITYVLTHSPLLSSASCFSYDVLAVLLVHQCTHVYDTVSIYLTTPPFLPFTFLYSPLLPLTLYDSEAAADVPRSLELAAYFTHCNLQPAHLMLALKTAMALAFKNKVNHPPLPCMNSTLLRSS